MFRCAIALTLLLCACKPQVVKVPFPVEVVVEKPQKLPGELLASCSIYEQVGRSVEEYIKSALTNTACARHYELQMQKIRGLQPED